MSASKFSGSRLRYRSFITTVFIITLLAACSFLLKAQQPGDIPDHGHAAPPGAHLLPRAKPPDCNKVHSADDQCAFVKDFCEDEDAGLLPYLEWYYCASSQSRPIAFILLVAWLGLLFTTIGIAASDFFSVNLSTIATILGLSESLAGVTFLAFGNGSPDVFSTFAAMSSNSPSMAVGELIGAACFITGVVAGSMALVREFRVDKKTYARDICFFIMAVAFSMAFLADGQLRFWECWAMVGYYIVYVLTVVGWHWCSMRRKRRLRREGEARSHYYPMLGHSGDQLAGEPYRDEPESLRDGLGHTSRSTSTHAISSLERVPRIEVEGRDQDYGLGQVSDHDGSGEYDMDDEHHDRMVAAEVSRSMRVLRPVRRKSHVLNPIRPSLVGALEFRSALAQLQKESNLQLYQFPGRSYSDYHAHYRPRRGTTSEVPDEGHWESLSTPGIQARDRAFSYGGTLPASAPPTSNLSAQEASEEPESVTSKDDHSKLVVTGRTSSAKSITPFMVGGNLAPPPVGPSGILGDAKSTDGGNFNGKPSSSLKLLIPSRRSSNSDASSPSSSFPRYTDSPVVFTPNVISERTDIMPPQAGSSRRENSFPELQSPVMGARRPMRWWPYSLLPPPHIVLATLFPTLQGWREKSIWDKFLRAITVPSIFLLVITLPVVETETTEESSLDDFSTLRGNSHLGPTHDAPLVPVGPHEIEPEGEWEERYRRPCRRNSADSAQPYSPRIVVNENDELSTWSRWLVCVQLFAGPLFAMAILWANMADGFSNPGKTLVKMVLYTLLASLVLLACLFLFTTDRKRPKYHFLLCFLGFIISIAWISTIANEVVGVLKTFGVVLNISEALLGLTIFAAGNSVGDLVADITVARLGYPVMALSACFGGPMLNILLGIGIGGVLMMMQHANKKQAKHPEKPVHYGPYSVKVGPTLLISAVTLLFILILLLIVVPLNKWILSRRIGWGLITLWTLSTIANVAVEVTGVWQES